MEKHVLSIEGLNAGIELWKTHSKWPKDFHSQLYLYLDQLLIDGVVPSSWDYLVDILWDWRAIRPKTKQFIRERGLASLVEIDQSMKAIAKDRGLRPSIMDVTWNEIEPLFQIAMRVKGVSRPVFASKLCHFLSPSVFPVVDNEFIGVNEDYKDYWLVCRRLWGEAENDLKAKLKTRLAQFIPPEGLEVYPWATKIVEVCLAGNSESITTKSTSR